MAVKIRVLRIVLLPFILAIFIVGWIMLYFG